MIYLRLAGGLGNQLYQLAAASLLCKARNTKVVIFEGGLTSYAVQRSPDSIKLIKAKTWVAENAGNQSKVLRFLSERMRCGRWLPRFGISDENYWLCSRNQLPQTLFMDGYFQSGWTNETLSSAISLIKDGEYVEYDGYNKKYGEVIIHIRGGDFLKLPEFQVVNIEFYEKAVRLAVDQGFREFALLSDDHEYALKMCKILRERVSFCSFNLLPKSMSALGDFEIIRSANARIIGNSTFAWWASALASQKTITWSCNKITKSKTRNYFLNNEIIV